MIKAELIKEMSAKLGCSLVHAENVVNAFEDTVKDGLRNDGEVKLVGFLTLKVVDKPARDYPNPQEPGKMIHKPAHKAVKISAGTRLSDSIL